MARRRIKEIRGAKLKDKTYDQVEYNRRWRENNKEKARYLSRRSTARTFINKYAQLEDLVELKDLIEKKEKELTEDADRKI